MLADFLLALESLGKNLITLDLGVWNLDGYHLASLHIDGTKNRGHIAPRNDAFHAVVIELVAGINVKSSPAGQPPLFRAGCDIPGVEGEDIGLVGHNHPQADLVGRRIVSVRFRTTLSRCR
jgi:hypothetical protein